MQIEDWLKQVGCPEVNPRWVRELGDGYYAMAKPLLFHWTVITGHFDDLSGYIDRWCFADKELALKALEQFKEPYSQLFEPDFWHRHPRTGRRRAGGSAEAETVDW